VVAPPGGLNSSLHAVRNCPIFVHGGFVGNGIAFFIAPASSSRAQVPDQLEAPVNLTRRRPVVEFKVANAFRQVRYWGVRANNEPSTPSPPLSVNGTARAFHKAGAEM
jgi:hypothetical protein